MADIDDLIKRLQAVREEFISALPDIAVETTITAKALVERNIREIGFGAQYSNTKVPAWFFLHKAKSNAGEAFIEKKIKQDEKGTKTKDGKKIYPPDEGMAWRDLREAEGLPVDHVDLSFTNKLWAGLGPQEPFFEGQIIRCPLGGNTQEVINKLNWNRARYGDFFGKVLQQKEIDILTGVVVDRVRQIFFNNGFNK